MNILITSGTFHPDIGGPPTYLSALCQSLVDRGHTVKVITFGRSESRYPYPVIRIGRELHPVLRLARFTLEVVQHGRAVDLIYVNDYGLPPAVANLALRKPMAIKLVGDFAWEYAIRHHLIDSATSIDDFQTRSFGSSVERVRAIQRWYVGRAQRVIVPSAYLCRLVSGWIARPERLRVVRNVPPHAQWRSKSEARSLLDLPNEGPVIVSLARLTVWKGIDHLIQALIEWPPATPRPRLVVVGDGPERSRLEALAAPLGPGARFLGEVEREQALAAIAAADIVALPSAYEGMSHVLLEAMLAGRAIVASAIGGNCELIRDGENGLLVPYGDARALSDALARLAREPELAARLADNARRESEQHTWDGLVDRTLEVFSELPGLKTT